uniref:Uncharacterized protein n=1 Tax=Physcomitrium patens TaxID=3218 RepID=A0A2K1K9R3_PHYPA|nr:hypothetical protein PHYPA_009695 [Physcomitrium patens]
MGMQQNRFGTVHWWRDQRRSTSKRLERRSGCGCRGTREVERGRWGVSTEASKTIDSQ